MATQRKTNFEALRCICAVMIVAGHITGETDIFRGGSTQVILGIDVIGGQDRCQYIYNDWCMVFG